DEASAPTRSRFDLLGAVGFAFICFRDAIRSTWSNLSWAKNQPVRGALRRRIPPAKLEAEVAEHAVPGILQRLAQRRALRALVAVAEHWPHVLAGCAQLDEIGDPHRTILMCFPPGRDEVAPHRPLGIRRRIQLFQVAEEPVDTRSREY